MYQMNEVMTLAFFFIGFIMLLFFLRREYIPRFPYLMAAYCCILASNLFSVIEGFCLYEVFNFLEHAAYLFSAIFMLVGVVSYRRSVL